MAKLFEKPQTKEKPRYISHRGFQVLAPENSLPSFFYAGYLRQWAIETDVHATRDGVLVCCHNASTSHYNEDLVIADNDWNVLRQLHIREGERLECFTEEELRLPLFSEYLAICKRFGSIPFIELKSGNAAEVMDAVYEAGLAEDEVVISTGKLEWLEDTRKASSDVFLHWIFAKEEGLEKLASLGNAGLSWNIPNAFECPPEKIELVKNMGLKVCLRAGDSVASVRHMFELGLDYIPTNRMHGILLD
jgi:glycerophosphoryl diester phosphodiesterase